MTSEDKCANYNCENEAEFEAEDKDGNRFSMCQNCYNKNITKEDVAEVLEPYLKEPLY